jgi:toxin ParE1/3/4
MANFNITPKAKEDLDNIWLYSTEKWSVKHANKHFKSIMKHIEFISKNRNSGKQYDRILNGLRGSIFSSHIIFYITNEIGNVEVIRIPHQRMDFDEHF